MKKEPKLRACLVNSVTEGDYYILQLRRRFLFFSWWETFKKGDNGLWNYGDAHFTKEQIDMFFEKWDEASKMGGELDVYKER